MKGLNSGHKKTSPYCYEEENLKGCTSGNVANSENVIDRIVWRDIERFVEFYELNKDFIDSL